MSKLALLVILAGVALVSSSPFLGSATNLLSAAANKAKESVSSVAEKIPGAAQVQQAAETAVNSVKEGATTATEAATSAASAAIPESVKNAAATAAQATTSVVNGVSNAVTDAANTGLDLLAKFTSAATFKGVDYLVGQVKNFLSKYDIVELPDIDTTFSSVNFVASEGYLKSMSSISKSGVPAITIEGTSINVRIPLHLENLEAGYKQFTAGIWKLSTSGNFAVSVEKNSLFINIKLTLGKLCALSLDKLEVEGLEGVDVKFEGICGVCGWAIQTISNAIASRMEETIAQKMESALNDAIQNVLGEDGDMCSKFF